jgi:hypothetical protein
MVADGFFWLIVPAQLFQQKIQNSESINYIFLYILAIAIAIDHERTP